MKPIAIGSIRAANINDLASEDSIRLGFIEGDGLLGDVLKSGFHLARVAEVYGWQRNEDETELQEARLDFYQRVKLLEVSLRLEKTA